MSIESALEDIAGKLHDYGDTLETEEATKNAFVMPFIASIRLFKVRGEGERRVAGVERPVVLL